MNQVNSKLDSQEHEERIRQINDRIGPFEHISAPPELTSVGWLVFSFLSPAHFLLRSFMNTIGNLSRIVWISFMICPSTFEVTVVRLFSKVPWRWKMRKTIKTSTVISSPTCSWSPKEANEQVRPIPLSPATAATVHRIEVLRSYWTRSLNHRFVSIESMSESMIDAVEAVPRMNRIQLVPNSL